MYLEIDEGFPEHPKTLKLCSLMESPLAGFYMFNLWKWACRSCQDGNLRGIGSYEIEEAARYHKHDGKLCASMVEAGFIDKDDEGNLVRLHNWMKRTGLAIKKMAEKAEENRKRRADSKAKHDAGRSGNQTGTEAEASRNRTGTNPSQTRQDKTRQDQTSQERESLPACDPSATATEHVALGQKRYSGWDLLQLFGATRLRVLSIQAPPGAGSPADSNGKAEAMAEALSPEASADVPAAMELFFRHVKAGEYDPRDAREPSFAFGSWRSKFEALREELHGLAPVVAKAEPRPAFQRPNQPAAFRWPDLPGAKS